MSTDSFEAMFLIGLALSVTVMVVPAYLGRRSGRIKVLGFTLLAGVLTFSVLHLSTKPYEVTLGALIGLMVGPVLKDVWSYASGKRRLGP